MEVSLKKIFSIVDSRLSTEIGDVYEMLNYIFNTNFLTHELHVAMDKLKRINPSWFENASIIISNIKSSNNTDDFNELMELIDKGWPTYKIKLEKLKINSYNEITIHPIKDSWNGEEVKNFGLWLGSLSKKEKLKTIDVLFDKWNTL